MRFFVLVLSAPPRIKAIKKEQKVFFFDWNAVSENGPRFENFVALHLLKWVYFQQDLFGKDLDLRFYRDKYGREVDFVILENRKPILFVEAKYSDDEISKGLIYLKSRYTNVRAIQVHLTGKKEYKSAQGIEVRNVIHLLKELI